jgi:hypothetical protein
MFGYSTDNEEPFPLMIRIKTKTRDKTCNWATTEDYETKTIFTVRVCVSS